MNLSRQQLLEVLYALGVPLGQEAILPAHGQLDFAHGEYASAPLAPETVDALRQVLGSVTEEELSAIRGW